ncbi:MAG: hypothetical protein L0215_06905 [Gemmataceae bacterium]|nr:hypothetical protein [Gemmataceae bacterium]
MNVREFLKNRESIDRAELLRHRGRWLALSEDGSKILAAAQSLEVLETTLVQQGIDPQSVHFEFLPGTEDDHTHFSPEISCEVPVSK